MARQDRPAAFFAMNVYRDASVQQVYEMCREVVRRLGRTDSGKVATTTPCGHGNYVVAFTSRAAADVFERLCGQQAGRRPRRSSTPPDGTRIATVEVVGGAVTSLADYMRRMSARLN